MPRIPTPGGGYVDEPASGIGDAASGTSGATSKTLFENYAQYVASVVYAQRIGSVPTIPNALAGGRELDTAILVDPVKIAAYRQWIADQLNGASRGPTFEDLSERIADVTLETVAQGASTLTISLIDPAWIIPMSGFITVDQTGYLWPPIDIHFPAGTDCVWRLVQYAPTWGQNTEANLTLTFEDKIASQLRQMSQATGGITQGSANQTLGGFFKQLIDSANTTLKTNIRLVELISPKDPNYTLPVTDLPASARRNLARKTQGGLTPNQLAQLDPIEHIETESVPTSGHTTISSVEAGTRWGIAGIKGR